MIPSFGLQSIRWSRAEQSAIFESFHGAEHRDRGRDDAITKQQRGTEEPEQHDHDAALHRFTHAVRGQGHQREHAALALVVRPQDEDEVFDADEQKQRPEDQRNHAKDVRMAGVNVMRAVRTEALLQRVDRRGADVPKHHAERRDDERGGGEFVETVTVLFFHDARSLRGGDAGASEGSVTGC